MSDPRVVVIGAAVLILFVGAGYQIGLAIYALGCFRKFNQVVDTVGQRFDSIDPDEIVENIANFFILIIGIVVLLSLL